MGTAKGESTAPGAHFMELVQKTGEDGDTATEMDANQEQGKGNEDLCDVFDGQYDPAQPGKSKVDDKDKVNRGAITVANKNDTDGDEKPDVTDDNGVPGEKDLIRVEIPKPAANMGDNKVKIELPAGVEVWREATKNNKEDKREFGGDDFPGGKRVIWIEGKDKSTKVRDVQLKITYVEKFDIVKLTFVWVDIVKQWCTRVPPGAAAENNIPANLDDAFLKNDIDVTAQAVDGSHYGHGPFEAVAGSDTRFGGRIVHEFEVSPPDVDKAFGKNLKFDVTRQIKYRDYKIVVAGGLVVANGAKDFPAGDEVPNDEQLGIADTDNDNTPKNGRIYSFDSPSNKTNAGGNAFVISRNTFKDWVRVRFDGGDFNDANPPVAAIGTRCSDKVDWHCVYYCVRDSAGKWAADSNATSSSASVRTATGTGTVDSVALGPQAVTEGFTATYDQPNKKWTLTGTSGDSNFAVDPNEDTWTISIDKNGQNKISVVIKKGGVAFATGDKFEFSVFKTSDARGKVNETGPGAFNLPNPDTP
jgi:hypothetical protein